ncbi:UNVERIFIED_CONTAM: hypothetical protein FKN15_061793 [Acipenser sinensis]
MFPASGRTGSLDELEEFAESYHQKGRRSEYRDPEPAYRQDCETKEHYPPPFGDQHHYRDDKPARMDRHQYQESFPDENYSKRDRSREGFYESDRGRPYSPPSPKRRDLSDCYPPRYPTANRAYDNTYLTSVLEKKARGRPPEESFSCETPCKSSSKKSSDIHYSRSASYRREEEDSLPPYSERDAERHRPLESSARPFSYTRDGTHEISMHAAHERREREKLRKTCYTTACTKHTRSVLNCTLLYTTPCNKHTLQCSNLHVVLHNTVQETHPPPSGCVAILVIVPETQRYTSLFASVRLRCDYSTSSNLQDVLVTWRYKSFCKDPILDYYSAGYQASLQLGQDPANDCSDSMREVRVVIQKRGGNEPVLGIEYRQRKITIQDKADLVISEVMWWDHGVYFCSIEASGDTTGDSDKEIKLVVYNWLVVIFIILGILLLILLLGVCWCQCCPHRCCCYVRCACCPTRCCCPEKAVMRYKMIKEAQKALMPWAVGQPIYAPQLPPPPHRGANNIQFRGGPPSILSSLNDIEVREIDRRVIHLPPIVEGLSHDNSSQGNRGYYSGSDRGARGPRNQGGSRSSQDSSLLNRQQPQDARRRRDDVQSNRRSPRRDFSPPRRQDLRSYSDESEYDGHRRPAAGRTGRGDTGGSGGSRYAGRRRSRSRDDLFNEPRRPQRRERSFSPPGRRSWSSDEDLSRRGGNGRSRNRDREGDWPEKPPSYSSVDILPGRANNRAHRSNEVYSVITKLLMLKQ